MNRTLLICASLACFTACKSARDAPNPETSPEMTQPMPEHDQAEEAATAPSTEPATAAPLPVERRHAITPEHYLFIGKPRAVESLDCDTFDSPEAPHRLPPQDLNDATDNPQRYPVSVQLVRVVSSPEHALLPEPSPANQEDAPMAHVAFALGTDASGSPDQEMRLSAYDANYCRRINALLASPYVVLHAYHIYVDRGNSEPDPMSDTWHSLGTDPSMANAGFKTIEEATRYADSLEVTLAEKR